MLYTKFIELFRRLQSVEWDSRADHCSNVKQLPENKSIFRQFLLDISAMFALTGLAYQKRFLLNEIFVCIYRDLSRLILIQTRIHNSEGSSFRGTNLKLLM